MAVLNIIPIIALLIIVLAVFKNPEKIISARNEIKENIAQKVEEVEETTKDKIKDATISEIRKATDDVLNNKELKKYESWQGFSFKYDPQIFKLENSEVSYGSRRIQAIGIVRYVNREDCGESGLPDHCKPFLENPRISFGVTGVDYSKIVADYLEDYLDLLEPFKIGDIVGMQYYSGVEGDGIITVLIPFKDDLDKTLIIQYTYDEIFDNDFFKDIPEILDSKGQKLMVDRILSSLEV
jgi:hypothetical protein